MPLNDPFRWRDHGIRIVHSDELDTHTPQTPGMSQAAAITHARAGAEKLWAGTVSIHPNAKTGAHHHGALESIIYVVRGRARMRWGERLEYVAEAGEGDFIFVSDSPQRTPSPAVRKFAAGPCTSQCVPHPARSTGSVARPPRRIAAGPSRRGRFGRRRPE